MQNPFGFFSAILAVGFLSSPAEAQNLLEVCPDEKLKGSEAHSACVQQAASKVTNGTLTHRHRFRKRGTCEDKKLEALNEYSSCYLRAGRRAFDKSLPPAKLAALQARCEARLEKMFNRANAGRRHAECSEAGRANEIFDILNGPLAEAQQKVAPGSLNCNTAPEDNTTERCVFSTSQLPLDLTNLVDTLGYSDVNPTDLVIAVEAFSGKGKKGDSNKSSGATEPGGSAGKHGYATTTWSLAAFQNVSKELYIYVGEQPDCGGCGGSSSIVFLSSVFENDTSNVLTLAGGSGGGGSAKESQAGGSGGSGGIALAGQNEPGGNAEGGGGKGGNSDGSGSGGAKSSNCSEPTDGVEGVGGYGGVKQNNKNSDRAGWIGTSTPSFADYSFGSGGLGRHSSSGPNGAAGGGGFGGGGGGCEGQGGGGAGSIAMKANFTGTAPSSCGANAIPDATGTCDQGGDDGVVVLNFRDNSQ